MGGETLSLYDLSLYDMVGLEQRLSDDAPNMVVLRQVKDMGALAPGAHHASQAELGQMLGHGCGLGSDVLG